MSKSLYLVNVIPQVPEGDHKRMSPSERAARDACSLTLQEAGEFVEAIHASNRREAMILVRRKYPGYLVLDKVVKAP